MGERVKLTLGRRDSDEAISLLESASAALWMSGGGKHLARQIDKFLDRVSPDSDERIRAALQSDK